MFLEVEISLMVCVDDNGAQTSFGDIEFGFYPTVAPKTVDHIFKLVRLGGYNTNHFFRVHVFKGSSFDVICILLA